MNRHTKWLWVVTVANAAVAALLLLSLYAIMLALAVLAPGISGWPVFVLLCSGFVLSVIGLALTKHAASRWSRIASHAVNGCALTLNLVVVAGMATIFIRSARESFIIPQGYRGDVYVVYGKTNCTHLYRTHGRVTYDIPNNGILAVCGTMDHRWTRTSYYYREPDGALDRIRNFWPSTISRTPENLANNSDVGIFFPRSGSTSDSTGCSVEYQHLYVGTKHHLLTEYKEIDLTAFLRAHPVGCK